MKRIFLLLVTYTCGSTLWSQGLLQLNSGVKVITSGSAYLVLNNVNIINNGSFQQTGGDGFVMMTGTSNVSLSGVGLTNLNALLLSKSGGAIVNLQSNLNIASKVNFSGGLLNLNNSTLNLGSSGIFTNESEASRAYTTGGGFIEASGNLNAPSSVNLGNLGAVISSPANLGNTIVRRGHTIQNGVSGSNNSIRRYYDIIPTNNLNLKAVLGFYYFDAELNGIPEASLYQWKSKDNINWDFVGAGTRNTSTNFIEKKSINWFARWTLAMATSPVITCPGNMTVSSNTKGCKALVSFAATATGIPSAIISYKIGNTPITSPYEFSKGTTTVTATASNGVLPDASCTFTVTVICGPVTPPVTTVDKNLQEVSADDLLVTARPNPSANYFTLNIKSNSLHPVTVRILDVLGRVVSVKPDVSSNTTLYIGHLYVSGIYFVQVLQERKIVTLKLIKEAY